MRANSRAIERGIAFLTSAQSADGSFATQISRTSDFAEVVDERLTTFAPVLMLRALCVVDGTEDIRRKLADWLLKQQSASGAFNYWPIDAAERHTRPYPDDLDDTACALASLYTHNPKLLDSVQLANMVRLLLAAETGVGGPYRTWLVGKNAPSEWQDVDLAVNANIQYLLQLVAEPLPKLHVFLAHKIATADFYSAYYPQSLIVAYFLCHTRLSRESTRQLKAYILRHKNNGFWPSPLRTAWACTALSKLTNEPHDVKQYLINSQLPNGSWPPECVWLDGKHGQQKNYAGSPALTTAFVLEALHCLQVPRKVEISPRKPNHLQPVFDEAIIAAKNQIDGWPVALRTSACAALHKLRQGETSHELVLLPYIFVKSLQNNPNLSDQFLIVLSLANIFGWMAYTIYDDLLDNHGKAASLPVANTAMRESLQYFQKALPNDLSFQQQVQIMFRRIDAANAWEAVHCRFETDEHSILVSAVPKYPSATFLAERSIGHALTPLAILSAVGIAFSDPRSQRFLAGFRHYLAARQLNDDLHDWQEDLQSGQISYVVARLLCESKVQAGKRSLAVLQPQLERQFWHVALSQLCAETSRQLTLSCQNFSESDLFQPSNMLLQLVARLEQSIANTRDEQKRAHDFLKQYTK